MTGTPLGPGPRLIAITDAAVLGGVGLLDRVQFMVGAARKGSLMILLRDKDRPIRERLELGREIRSLTRGSGQWFSVADRLDLGLLLEVDAIHLGERAVTPEAARAWFRSVGRSVFVSSAWHELSAPPQGIDAALLSPIAAPRKGQPEKGISSLGVARQKLGDRVRLYALGGIDAGNAGACLQSGADGVAVIGAAFGPTLPTPLFDVLGLRALPAGH